MARALNRKQLAFVERYLEGVRSGKPNGTAAYMAAFGCRSRDAARSAAARLLKDARVKELLHPVREAAEVARVEQVTAIEITRDRIRLELARLSFVDPRRLFHEDGRVKGLHEMDADTAAAIASIEVEERTSEGDPPVTIRTKRVKFWDKVRALQLLADTEFGTWAADAKGSGPTTNVTIDVNARIMSLTAEDVLATEKLLATVDARRLAAQHPTERPP